MVSLEAAATCSGVAHVLFGASWESGVSSQFCGLGSHGSISPEEALKYQPLRPLDEQPSKSKTLSFQRSGLYPWGCTAAF